MDSIYSFVSGELLVSPLGLCSSLLSFSMCFVYSVVSLFFCYLLVLFVASQ
jgi:hypothetical protein